MLGCNAQRIGVTSHLLNAGAVVCLITAIVTQHWLWTIEHIPDHSDPFYITMKKAGIKVRNITYDERQTYSGMWIFCQQNVRRTQSKEDCFWIDHGIPDHSHVDSTNATTCIVYATMISMPSLLSAASVTFLGLITNMLIRCRKIWIFVTGIIYILAGICTFTCIVLYITYVIQELEHKSEEKKADGDAKFESHYGYSIYLAMISFCCQELGGISLIYLSICRFNKYWKQKDLRLREEYRQLQQPQQMYSLPESACRFPYGQDYDAMELMTTPNGTTTYNSSTWNGRLAEHDQSMQYQLSRSVNVSPSGTTRRHMTTPNPDMDMRTRDVYIGNHIKCSYDNKSFMTPFPLALRGKHNNIHLATSSPLSDREIRLQRSHLYQSIPTPSRQVTFSSSPNQHNKFTVRQDPRSHAVPIQAGSVGRSGRHLDDCRMTPV